jgi:hypothetical protein
MGNWDSLEDNPSLSDWLEANPSAMQLAELKTDGVEVLAGGEHYDLGQIFSTSGTQDLVFEYLPQGASSPVAGRVLYTDIPQDVEGDYNSDGVVNLADYTVWRDNLGANITLQNESPTATPGQVTVEDYTVWKSNFGAPSTATLGFVSVNVPEPQSVVLLSFALASMLLRGVGLGKEH